MATSARKLAIVTGTSSGVGAAAATRFLERDWNVIGVSRRASSHADSRYRHLRLDLSDLASVTSAFERDVAPTLRDDDWSRIALVNNAASVGLLGPIERLNASDLVSLYALNLATPLWCMGFVSRHAPKSVALRMVNVSSGAAVRAFAGLGAYGSSKAGLRMGGMVLAEEWESTVRGAPTRSNAAILSYEPGTVDTPMQEAARSYSTADFPWVGMFTAIRDRGALVPAEAPAAEIVSFAESDGLPMFSERRIGR